MVLESKKLLVESPRSSRRWNQGHEPSGCLGVALLCIGMLYGVPEVVDERCPLHLKPTNFGVDVTTKHLVEWPEWNSQTADNQVLFSNLTFRSSFGHFTTKCTYEL